jgi:integrase
MSQFQREQAMSIRQREWTTPSGKKRSAWIVDYFDAKGVRRLKTFRTKREADDWRSGAKIELKQGTHVAARDGVTVADAGKLWIEACETDKIEPATVERYKQILNLHIVPYLGRLKLHEITVPRLRAFEDELRAAGASHSLIKSAVTRLSGLLSDAVDRGLVPGNVVKQRKRIKRGLGADRHDARLKVGVDIPSPAEVRVLITAAQGYDRALIVTAALTGLRASELRGLPWHDVDLAGATITVSQRADKFGTVGSPKAPSSRRTVPVPPLVVNTLKEWKLACPKGELGLVFPDAAGQVERYQHIQRDRWHPLQVAAGVANEEGEAKYSGLHGLRHFFASWCANSRDRGGLGLTLKETQARMGHSTLAMTADTYGHLFPSTDDAEVLAAGERALMGA